MTRNTLPTCTALLLAAGLSAGCASNKDIEALRSELSAVSATANDSKATADRALATANEAKATADEANARSEATDVKIDRMFKRSMFK